MRIRYAHWTAAMTRIMVALAMHGALGPDGHSVAAKYLAVLAALAAERGPDFAIEYDRDLRRHIALETIPVADAVPLFRVLDDPRAAALQRSKDAAADRERSRKASAPAKPTQPLQAASQSSRSSGRPPRDRRRDRPSSH